METKLKVKTESPPERCEICHQTDCFDPHNNYCSRCSIISIQLHQQRESLEFHRSNENTVKGLLVTQYWKNCINHPISKTIKLMAWFFLIIYISSRFPFPIAKLFLLIPIPILFALLCVLLREINRTTVELSKDKLSVRSQPIPSFSSTDINPKDIQSLYCAKSSRFGSYSLRAILNNGTHTTILKYLEAEKALLIERHIGEFLGKPISGKVQV
jgi:hypothetical protein